MSTKRLIFLWCLQSANTQQVFAPEGICEKWWRLSNPGPSWPLLFVPLHVWEVSLDAISVQSLTLYIPGFFFLFHEPIHSFFFLVFANLSWVFCHLLLRMLTTNKISFISHVRTLRFHSKDEETEATRREVTFPRSPSQEVATLGSPPFLSDSDGGGISNSPHCLLSTGHVRTR